MLNIEKIKKEIEKRSKYLDGQYKPWQYEKISSEDASQEFKKLNTWRQSTWYSNPKDLYTLNPDFILPPEIIKKNIFRAIEVTAFEYNCTTPEYYNSSTIIWDDPNLKLNLTFLALEAPAPKPSDTSDTEAEACSRFYKLLSECPVTHLVRITPEKEIKDGNTTVKCYPYWNNLKNTNQDTAEVSLSITNEKDKTTKAISYYEVDNWIDNTGSDSKELLDLVLKVRNDAINASSKKDSEPALIAVHCHSGVGRTGTFIALYILIAELEKQLSNGKSLTELDLSIEQVVKRLSLQRLNLVSEPGYYMLYNALNLYYEIKLEQIKQLIKDTALKQNKQQNITIAYNTLQQGTENGAIISIQEGNKTAKNDVKSDDVKSNQPNTKKCTL